MVPSRVESIATFFGGHGLPLTIDDRLQGLHNAAADAFATLVNAFRMADTLGSPLISHPN